MRHNEQPRQYSSPLGGCCTVQVHLGRSVARHESHERIYNSITTRTFLRSLGNLGGNAVTGLAEVRGAPTEPTRHAAAESTLVLAAHIDRAGEYVCICISYAVAMERGHVHKVVAVNGARILVAKIRTAAADQLRGIVVRRALFRIAVALSSEIGFLRQEKESEVSTFAGIIISSSSTTVPCTCNRGSSRTC
jgi:hypothetical protein